MDNLSMNAIGRWHLHMMRRFEAKGGALTSVRVILVEILLLSTFLSLPVFLSSALLSSNVFWIVFLGSWSLVSLALTFFSWILSDLRPLLLGFLFFVVLLGLSLQSSPAYLGSFLFLVLVPFLAVSFCGWKLGVLWTLLYTATVFTGAVFSTPNEGMVAFRRLDALTQVVIVLFLFGVVSVSFAAAAALFGAIEGLLRRLSEAKEKLEAGHRERLAYQEEEKRFFQIMSHDLRAPITKITQFLGIYLEQRSTFDEDVWPQVLRDIYRSSEGLSVLLENLFHWFKVRQGKDALYCESFQLHEISEEIVRIYKPMARSKNIALECDASPNLVVYSDGFLVSTILRNLLSNALKFTPRGGSVKLEAGINRDQQVFLRVSDTGRGIDDELWRRIQTEAQEGVGLGFMRGTDNEAGSGFGLKVCLLLAERLRGKLESESFDGVTSPFVNSFVLTFPREL